MTPVVDRRKFLQQSGAGVGGLLASPRLAIVGAMAAGLGFTKADADSNEETVVQRRVFIHANEPVNTSGHPFGFDISTLNFIPLPEVTAVTGRTRFSLVIGHLNLRKNCDEKLAQKSIGITMLEITCDASGRWIHDVAAVGNRRFDAVTPVPIDGARLGTGDAPMFRQQQLTDGTSGIVCSHATPWLTVLCGEASGWIIEVQPRTGSVVKRFSLGRIYPAAMTSFAETGEQAAIYVLSQAPQTTGHRIFKFVTHQRFDARRGDANSSLLVIGDLLVADPASGAWLNLTRDLDASEWQTQMQAICERSDLPNPQTDFSETAFAKLANKLTPQKPGLEIQGAGFEVETLEDGAARLWVNARIKVSK